MPRSGPRPHVWKVQGQVPHQQSVAYQRMKAQAKYRNEAFELTFEEFQQLWMNRWDQRGRGADQYCLTRQDPDQPWNTANCQCVTRKEYLQRQEFYKSRN